MLYVSRFTSAKRGTALKKMAASPPKCTIGSQITSNPGPAPETLTASASPLIAEFLAMALLAPTRFAKASSNRRVMLDSLM